MSYLLFLVLLFAGCNAVITAAPTPAVIDGDMNEIDGTGKQIRVICSENMAECTQKEYPLICVSENRYQELITLQNGTI